MNPELLEQAKLRIPSIPVLVNVVSMRFKQLNENMRPLVKPLSADEDRLDIVLREIAEGKLLAQYDFENFGRKGS
ncbi:MAG: DNA-directed RNA polymerase subunit omega [Lentisphaerae bacterium]|jgi:DNA-directed RNA polymerase subunit K/omega|nr:DNA-directed RNA polymerase subunit omega [Lentisphaerota bacterium]